MTGALTWIVVLLVIVIAFWSIVRENDRRRRRSVEEWENSFPAGRGKLTQFIQAGALGLESILMDEKRNAIEYKQDEKQGQTRTGSKGDDADRSARERQD
jgi:hypothetical protein